MAYTIDNPKRVNISLLRLKFVYAGFHSVTFNSNFIRVENSNSGEEIISIYENHNYKKDYFIEPKNSIVSDGSDSILVAACGTPYDEIPVTINEDTTYITLGENGYGELRIASNTIGTMNIVLGTLSKSVEVVAPVE